MIVLTIEELADFRAGYRAGHDAGADGSRVPPAAYYDAPKWERMGWVIGNDDRVQGRDAVMAGERVRALGLPVEVNPWVDRPKGTGFSTGWSCATPAAIRWAMLDPTHTA
ncbi:hypothetical protein GAY33_34410 [Azospirillum brasilense]|uniref:hypothetical protein n=1 Tax=Azospirillum argentinense TaxID=2970906 RepID=UPI00190E91A6|nr:hypothetical protein [Azospirillum argentinense]MBK3804166.1 hypothetical protein [Azospirillum argentinense]